MKIWIQILTSVCHYLRLFLLNLPLSDVGNPGKDATFNFQVGRAEKREAKGAKETGARAAGFHIFEIIFTKVKSSAGFSNFRIIFTKVKSSAGFHVLKLCSHKLSMMLRTYS